MPEKIKWKGGALLSPLPAVMVTCGTLEKPNIITIGWTGILCTNPPKTYISVRPERYSYEIIKNTGKFVINLTTAALARACDFCGVRSGSFIRADCTRFRLSGLRTRRCSRRARCR